MSLSVSDLFTIGIGPSSSHTVGPMRAAARFAAGLQSAGMLPRVTRVRAQLFGSLGATGFGHGSGPAVLSGLEGNHPETVDTDGLPRRAAEVTTTHRLQLGGSHEVGFDPDTDLVLHRRKSLPFHPNGMIFTAWSEAEQVHEVTYYSVGGGFVLEDDGSGNPALRRNPMPVPHPFSTGAELQGQCDQTGLPISAVALDNERARAPEDEVYAGLDRIWQVMGDCIARGERTTGDLPGGLRVRRRAAELYNRLVSNSVRPASTADPLQALDWIALWALAVNEENASGGRVVTAPTNGAAGVLPAVLQYAVTFVPGTATAEVRRFLLTAGAIGAIYAQTASISGAEVGCQGEVGTACSMAAAALTELMGGTPAQALCAAEIGMEHHLGLTCDPVGGLVQIPCIERNAVAAVQAITAARLALHGDGSQKVSLDQVIKTMMATGADMKVKYKETSRGGLAVNIIEC